MCVAVKALNEARSWFKRTYNHPKVKECLEAIDFFELADFEELHKEEGVHQVLIFSLAIMQNSHNSWQIGETNQFLHDGVRRGVMQGALEDDFDFTLLRESKSIKGNFPHGQKTLNSAEVLYRFDYQF